VRQALAGQTATSEQFIGPADAAPRLGAAAPIAGLGWVATADRPLSEALGPIEATARQEGVLLLIVLGLVLLLAAFLAYMLTQPLRALEAAVAAVRRGDYARRVAVHGSDEVADLAASFNAMAERLEALEQERVAFAAMVAHDLRSPLTAVRGTAQILQRRGDDDPDLQRGLETIVRETDRVARLAADFGDAVNAAAGQLELRPARVDLVELVVEAVERLKAAGTAQPIALDAVPQSIRVDADPQRIAQVLDNLLGNAAKYSPSDQPIAVQVRTNGEARVSVQDRGPGIAPEDLPRLFERFYRTRTARRGSKGGSGLGLYISQRIAAAHGGRLRAESTLGAGSCFTLILPLPRAGGGPPPRSADGPPLR
jgi:signal transduction histidine kinase